MKNGYFCLWFVVLMSFFSLQWESKRFKALFNRLGLQSFTRLNYEWPNVHFTRKVLWDVPHVPGGWGWGKTHVTWDKAIQLKLWAILIDRNKSQVTIFALRFSITLYYWHGRWITVMETWPGLIGHFRILLCLCFKASLSAKPFIWKWVLHAVSFSCK